MQSIYDRAERHTRQTSELQPTCKDLQPKDDPAASWVNRKWNWQVPRPFLDSSTRIVVWAMAARFQWVNSIRTKQNKEAFFYIHVYSLSCTIYSSLFHSIHPDFRPFVYCVGIRSGGQSEYQFAVDMYNRNLTEYIASERVILLEGLACVREPWLQQL